MGDTPWCGGQADKLYLQSGQFSATMKTSLDVSAVDATTDGITWDGANTPWTGGQADKLYLQSGQFSGTMKTSLDVSTIDTGSTDISWDGANTPWCGYEAAKLYLQSGQFSSTLKTSLSVGAFHWLVSGISFDGMNTPWTGGGDKLYLQSGQFSSTMKTSLDVSAVDNRPEAVSFDGANTPWAGDEADKLYLQSGQFSGTLKTSLDVSTIDTSVWGIDTTSVNGRLHKDVNTYRQKPVKGNLLQRGHKLAKHLIASYLFNEGTGEVVYDQSDIKNHASTWTSMTSANWGGGRDGTALKFAIGDYIEAAHNDVFNGLAQISFEIIFQLPLLPSETGQAGAILFRKQTPTSVQCYGRADNNRLDSRLTTTAATYVVVSDNAIERNRWHHVIGTYDGTIFKVYVDGAVQADTEAASGNVKTSSGTLSIGGVINWTSLGNISLLNFYDKALSQEEINSQVSDPYQMFRV